MSEKSGQIEARKTAAIVKSEAQRMAGQDRADIAALCARFLLQLDALVETANRIMIITMRSRDRAQQELDAFTKPRVAASPNGKSFTLTSFSSEFREFQKLNKDLNKASEAVRLVPRSFLVSMVTQYDTFLAGAVRKLFKLKPDKVKSAENSMKVKEIVRFSSIDELLQRLIDDEIDDVLRGSHSAQLDWVSKRFDFTIEYKEELLQNFIELTERRNAYVHTDGKVSRQYIAVCNALPDAVPCLNLGDQLPLRRSYLEKARDTLFEVGIRVLQIAWRKQRDDQKNEQDLTLNEVIFDLLSREDYRLARNLADFATSLRNYASERNKRLLAINQAQAYKWSGKEEEAIKIIDKIDWSSASANFQVAVAVLRDDFEGAARFMPRVATDPNLDEDSFPMEVYRTWPLFKEARKQKPILDAFEAIFHEPLVGQTVIVPTATQSIM